MMFGDIFKEFILELVRALFIEELCQRVKNKLVGFQVRKRSRRRQAFYRRLQARQRDRLLHRLFTEEHKKM